MSPEGIELRSPRNRLCARDLIDSPMCVAAIPIIEAATALDLSEDACSKFGCASEVSRSKADASLEVAMLFVFSGGRSLCECDAGFSLRHEEFDYATISSRVVRSHAVGYPDDDDIVTMTTWHHGQSAAGS